MATKRPKPIVHPRKRDAFRVAQKMAIKELYVTSSMVHKLEYNSLMETLIVQFNDGGRYLYKNVPESVFKGLKRTPSVGKYMHKFVIGNYLVIKL